MDPTQNNNNRADYKKVGGKLWASIYLPDLQLDAMPDNAAAIAITERCNNRLQIRSCNQLAKAAGVYSGMALNSAYAIEPSLAAIEYDAAQEATLLKQTGEWAMQFSSIVCLHPPNHILIEIAGSKKLFDGFEALLSLLQQELGQLGYCGTLGIAPTPHAANLLARANLRRGITQLDRLPGVLGELPVELLELPGDTIESLRRSGIRQIRSLLNVSPASLTRRFGPGCVNYIDRLLGRHPDPRTPLRLSDYFERALDLPLEVEDTNALQFATQRMINELAAFLIAHDNGVNQFRFTLRHERHTDTRLVLRFLQATSQSRHLHRVLSEKLSQIELPAAVCGLHLLADTFSEIERDAADLFVKSRRQQKSLGEVIDKLSSRLGNEAVYTLATADDHRPEKAWKKSFPDMPQEALSHWPERPLWLFDKPEPVSTARRRQLTIESEGERIETGWWEEQDVRRDYFIANDNNGTRYWAFTLRDRPDQLYLHGIYA